MRRFLCQIELPLVEPNLLFLVVLQTPALELRKNHAGKDDFHLDKEENEYPASLSLPDGRCPGRKAATNLPLQNSLLHKAALRQFHVAKLNGFSTRSERIATYVFHGRK